MKFGIIIILYAAVIFGVCIYITKTFDTEELRALDNPYNPARSPHFIID